MDKEFIRELLFTEDGTSEKLIKDGDFIDSELLEILKKASRKNLQKAFYAYKGSTHNGVYKYSVELKCPICNKTHAKIVSKTKLMEILGYSSVSYSNRYLMYCEICREKEEIEERRKKQECEKRLEEEVKERISKYIAEYINPNNTFKKEIQDRQKIDYIMGLCCSYKHNEEVEKAVKNLDYYDFLKTPYWDGIRSYKLKKAHYCCELCGKKGVLNVHHKTYEHHGLEHLKGVADKDLIVLCRDCHEKFHEKLAED